MHRMRCLALAAVLVIPALATTSCGPTIAWSNGKTHGLVVETGAARAGVNIYRAPRKALYQVWQAGGIELVQDALWHFGQPPKFSVCPADMACLTSKQVADRIHGWIYGDPWDLKGALLDAQRETNCLSLTLVSRFSYIKNWTRKNVGCRIGSLPGAPAGVSGVDTDPPLIPNGESEPLPADDHLPSDYLQPAP